MAKTFGATEVFDSSKADVVEAILGSTKDGVDVAIEAVGIPATFDICQSIVRPGGHIANVGVHGKSVDFQIQKLWIQNITLTTGLVNTNTTPMLLKTVESRKLQPENLITHRFTFDQLPQAYEVFGNAAKQKALKVIIGNG
jgi:alcohol dehydrogenase